MSYNMLPGVEKRDLRRWASFLGIAAYRTPHSSGFARLVSHRFAPVCP